MKIGIDLDGPLYPFGECLWEWCVTQGLKEGEMPVTTTWNFFKDDWGHDLDWYMEHCTAAAAAGHLFYSQEPHPGAIEGMNALRERGHTLHIMTYRMFSGAVNNTERWLVKHNVPFDSLSFTKDKTLIPVEVMIEDNVDNANSLAEAGVIPVIVDRPWNKEWDGPRVGYDTEGTENDWPQFVEIVDGLEQYINSWYAHQANQMVEEVQEQSGLIVVRR